MAFAAWALLFATSMDGRTVASFPCARVFPTGAVFAEDGSFVAFAALRDGAGHYHYRASNKKLSILRDVDRVVRGDAFRTGLVGLLRAKSSRIDVMDLATGRLLFTKAGTGLDRASLSGEWLLSSPGYNEPWTAENVRTRVRSARADCSVVWLSKGRAYTVARAPGDGRPHGPYWVWETRDRSTFRVLRSVPFGDTELTFDQLLGDPERPPFAVERSFVGVGVEAMAFDVFKQQGQWQGTTYSALFDFGPWGVLYGTKRVRETYSFPTYDLAFRPLGGRKDAWNRTFDRPVTEAGRVGTRVLARIGGHWRAFSLKDGAAAGSAPDSTALTPAWRPPPPRWELRPSKDRKRLDLVDHGSRARR